MDGILFIILVAMTLLGMALSSFIENYLKKKHTAVWAEIGSPSLFLNNSIRNTHLFGKFVKEQMFGKIDDPFLTRLCKIQYFYKIAYFLYFGVLAVMIVSKW
jgi:hypothetical protein